MNGALPSPARGRGATVNPAGRFNPLHIEPDPDLDPADLPAPATRFYIDDSRTFITANDSPDIPFRFSANPYRGCEHGCAYCYARPTHEYLGFSPGLEFETRILVKTRAPEILRAELAHPRWRPETVVFSGVTDCYQPAERHFCLTRQCLEVFLEFRHPVSIVTKSHLITRDTDTLAALAQLGAVRAFLSITTLDPGLARDLEPRAPAPGHRLDAIARLRAAGIPCGVVVSPIIPTLNDHEIPAILRAAREAGAQHAAWTLLRLPHGVADIFDAWLKDRRPLARERVLKAVRSVRGGNLNDSRFGHRFRGDGRYADQIARLFQVLAHRSGLNVSWPPLSTSHFRRPGPAQAELALNLPSPQPTRPHPPGLF